MSHVATVEIEVKDLLALDDACKRLGLELVKGQETYRWFGEYVGGHPLPDGFTAENLGVCDHAIRLPDNPDAYEIGVVRNRSGKAGYSLLWDFWEGGFGLEDIVGEDCSKLKQAYAACAATRQAIVSGFRVQEQTQEDGSIRLVLSK